MSALDIELDHVGVAVRDLDAAKAAYERLGFTLTARSLHSGSITPDGPVEPWGSGNHCAMFRNGYLEILGIFDWSMHSNAKKLLDKYEGAHIVAFGSGDTEESWPILSKRHSGLKPAIKLERDAPFGLDGKETRRARFRNTNADPEQFPEARYIFIEHLTRDVLWQPHLLDHANGALAMQEVAIATDDVAGCVERLGRVLDLEPNDKGHGIFTFELLRGTVYVLPGALVPKWAKGVQPPRLPYVAGFGVTVRDVKETKAFLAQQGVMVNHHPYPAVWVPPAFTCGPVVSFIQA